MVCLRQASRQQFTASGQLRGQPVIPLSFTRPGLVYVPPVAGCAPVHCSGELTHRVPRLCWSSPAQLLAPRRLKTTTQALSLESALVSSPGTPGTMSLGKLFLASLVPVMKVGLLCSVGAVASKQGLLSLEGRRVISGLIFNVFTPCLFLDKLGSGVGFWEAIALWPLTFNMIATHVLGGLLGWVLVKLTRPPAELRPHMVVATMVGNTGNLPLVLLASLGSDPTLQALGGAALAVQYVILSNFSAAFIQFPAAVLGLRTPVSPQATAVSSAAAAAAAAAADVRAGKEDTASQPLLSSQPSDAHSRVGTSSSAGRAESATTAAPSKGFGDRLRQAWAAAKPLLDGVLSPPTIACCIALTVASIKPVQAAVFSPDGALRLLGETTSMLGNLAIPCLMLVLGANLARGPGVASIPWQCIAATVVCRLVLLPLVGTGMVMSMRSMGLLDTLQPIGIIAMLLTHAVPTAIMVHSMSTMYRNREDDVAALLFYEYMASAITLPLLLAFFLSITL